MTPELIAKKEVNKIQACRFPGCANMILSKELNADGTELTCYCAQHSFDVHVYYFIGRRIAYASNFKVLIKL